MKFKLTWVIATTIALFHSTKSSTTYLVGVGIADITGPAADINMLGYANPGQIAAGIHTRQYARTFLIGDGTDRVVFVNADCGFIDQIVKLEVVKRLSVKYGTTYTMKNLVISATHTHSGPGGFMQYLLFTLTSLGFVEQSFEALVSGIVLSVERAHTYVNAANIYYSSDILLDANYNRSPASYMNNPAEERAKYEHDTDKDMVQLKFVTLSGEPLGILNWYAVHLTSLNNTNSFISSDNKGVAALQFEAHINGDDVLPGKGRFIAAFAQSNLGDVSPNILGARCLDTGLPCDLVTSTCNNRTQLCIAFGPGKDMYESSHIIGSRQFKKAVSMFDQDVSDMEQLEGPVNFAHQFVDMPNYAVEIQDTDGPKTVKLCKPALGHSFAAGTTDGPGAFDFTQGTTSPNPFWNLVASVAIQEPSQEQIDCHLPKPVLISTGEITWPYQWHPDIVETQMLRIGQVMLAAVPGEFTTMAGRRLREQLIEEAKANGAPSNIKAVIAGLSNLYTHYVTTLEEYQIQRYEGASTIYGPHTLSAYLDQFKKLTRSLFGGDDILDGPSPPNLLNLQISLVPGVVFDRAPVGKSFGDCLVQPYPLVNVNETVYATFVSGNPRNNLMTESTFLTVERQNAGGSWSVYATDAHFDTIFSWKKTTSAQSEAQVRWNVGSATPDGTYRLKHFGYYKNIDGSTVSYDGTSQVFRVNGV